MTHLNTADLVMFAAVSSRRGNGSRSDLAFVASNMLHGGLTDEFKSEIQTWQTTLDRLLMLGYVYEADKTSYEPTSKGREVFIEAAEANRDLALRIHNATSYGAAY